MTQRKSVCPHLVMIRSNKLLGDANASLALLSLPDSSQTRALRRRPARTAFDLAKLNASRTLLPVQKSPGPGVDGRLAGLITGLAKEGNQGTSTGAFEAFLFAIFLGDLRSVREVDFLRATFADVRIAGFRFCAFLRSGGLDDDVARDDLDVLIAQCGEHCQAGVEGDSQSRVVRMFFDESADVGDLPDFAEESGVRSGHVFAHLVDEAGWRGFLGRVRLVAFFLSGRTMLDVEDQIEELDDAALSIAAARELYVSLLVDWTAVVKDYAVGQACICHVLAASKVRADAVVEDMRIAVVVHLSEKGAQLVNTLSENAQRL